MNHTLVRYDQDDLFSFTLVRVIHLGTVDEETCLGLIYSPIYVGLLVATIVIIIIIIIIICAV